MEPKSNSLFLPLGSQECHSTQSIQRPTITYWQDAWLRLSKNRVAMVSGAFIVFLSFAAFAFPPLLQYDYETQEVWNKHAAPNLGQLAVVDSGEPYIPRFNKSLPLSDLRSEDAPPIPTKLRLLGKPTTRQVAITWEPVAGADGYRVYRSTEKETLGLPLADLTADDLSFRDNAWLVADTTYYYAVAAFNSFGDSPPSGILEVKPRLSITLDDAQKFVATVNPGEEVRTFAHYLGTDYLGRDMLARLLVGARISLSVGIVAPLLFVFIGVIYGCVSGYFGGTIDNVMMRIAEILVTIPNLLILIMLQVVMGSGAITLVIALVISDWASVSQQIRGEVLRIRSMEFIHAAEILGTSFWRIIFRHILPNVMGTVLVLFSIAIPRVIFTEAFLSFIGLGIAPPLPSLGSVTRDGAAVMTTYPLELLIPGILLSLTVLAFNLFGDGMRDALDPKQRGTR